MLAQASVVGPQGTGVSGLAVAFRAQGATKTATACGAGCYRATLATTGKPASVDVMISGRDAVHWQVALPATWPAPDGTALLARAGAVWRSLRLAAATPRRSRPGPATRVLSTWQAVAPDRIAYEVKGGWAGIVVGETRWDKGPGARRWVSSPQTRLTQPVPGWVKVHGRARPRQHHRARAAGLARVLLRPGDARLVHRARGQVVAPQLPVRMTATSHFMQDDYGAFNATAPIRPPR